jgi:hypothetical protein
MSHIDLEKFANDEFEDALLRLLKISNFITI